ncbi:hypothetical protein KP509_1Z228800 [Ceratopteris richardii]|nr:hypothetical protein KP509_1Z228800 [Ceratopteris richardii]
MTQLEGQTILRGKPGYVSQNPWILSGTVRDNILFGKSYFKERYDRVLSACALDIDVERMVGKDLCIIGEQGFNLSGGQRSRIALARAIYHDCDILILDDPLSSLDAHVATWILDHAFSGTLLANKTIVLATYKVQALSMADMVIVLEDGVMTYCGKTEQFKEEFGNDYNRGESLTDHYISYYMKNGISEKIIEHGGEICSSHPVEEINSHLIENPVPLVEEEGRVQGAVQAIVYWTYATFMGRRLLFLIFASTALMQMSRNGSDFWLSVWVDRSSWKAINGGQFFLVVFICLAAANSVFTAARAFSFAYGGISAAFQVHESLLKRVIEAPIKFFESNPKGRILNRFSSDQYAVDDSLPFISNILLANSFSLLGIIVILCIVQWTFLVILFPLGYIYIGLQKYYRCTSRELRRLDSTSRSPIYNSFNDALDGSTTIRAFQVQSMFCRKNASDITLNQRSSFSEIAASIWLSIRLQLLAACIIFFISTMSIWSHGVRTPIGHTTSGLV